jgi:tRNA threonylcarbamoyladenosine biosynthesis protein TsaB
MRILYVDTCGATASVAVGDGDRVAAETTLAVDRRLSTRLLAVIDALLGETGMSAGDLDAYGVTRGPGSFTGVRVGMATVKGMALAAGKPVVGVSSLVLVAANLPFARHQVCALLDARKKEVYAGLFACTGAPAPVAPEWVVPPETLCERITEPTLFVGDGATAYRQLIEGRCGSRASFAPFPCSFPRAANGILLARLGFERGEALPSSRLTPVYIRPSEAEVNKAG